MLSQQEYLTGRSGICFIILTNFVPHLSIGLVKTESDFIVRLAKTKGDEY